jgi:hypothetical protein
MESHPVSRYTRSRPALLRCNLSMRMDHYVATGEPPREPTHHVSSHTSRARGGASDSATHAATTATADFAVSTAETGMRCVRARAIIYR